MITFDPPVASWSFTEGHVLDELWQEITQASHHLLFTNQEAPFDTEMQDKLRHRILGVLANWVAQKWLTIPDAQQAQTTPSSLESRTE